MYVNIESKREMYGHILRFDFFFCDTVIDKSYHLKRVKIPLLSYWYGIMAEDCCCQHSGRRQTRSFSKAWRWKSWRSAQH